MMGQGKGSKHITMYEQISRLEIMHPNGVSKPNPTNQIPMGKSFPFYYKWHAKTYRVQIIENKVKIITYLNINRMLIIDFENISKYVLNMRLFHSILKKIFLPQVLPIR
jgi:hypothetical protein